MPSRARRGPDVDQGHRERQRRDGCDALTCWVGWWACQDLNLGPHPYQQSAGNRCAAARFPRSRSTVGAKVKCSNSLQLSALPTHRNRADIALVTAALQQYAKPLHWYLLAHTPLPCYLSIPLPPPSALPHQPDLQPLIFPLSHCPPLIPSKSNTRQQLGAGGAQGAKPISSTSTQFLRSSRSITRPIELLASPW